MTSVQVGPKSMVHLVKRGARGMEIVRDTHDRERFLDTLYFLNDEYQNLNWGREIEGLPRLSRPPHWPERKPLVDIHAWTLLDNHLHMLIQIREDRENGLAEFAQRLFRSMTGYFNERHGGHGSIFQGPYKVSVIDSDEYLRYVIPYIIFKNVLDMHPEGPNMAARDFDIAWKWASEYPYSSLRTHLNLWEPGSHILTTPNIVNEMFPEKRQLQEAAKDMLLAYAERRKELGAMQLEE